MKLTEVAAELSFSDRSYQIESRLKTRVMAERSGSCSYGLRHRRAACDTGLGVRRRALAGSGAQGTITARALFRRNISASADKGEVPRETFRALDGFAARPVEPADASAIRIGHPAAAQSAHPANFLIHVDRFAPRWLEGRVLQGSPRGISTACRPMLQPSRFQRRALTTSTVG